VIALRRRTVTVVHRGRRPDCHAVVRPLLVSRILSRLVARFIVAVSGVLRECAGWGSALVACRARTVALVLAVVLPLAGEIASLVRGRWRRLVVVGAR
jgi:hypothetical protein